MLLSYLFHLVGGISIRRVGIILVAIIVVAVIVVVALFFWV